MSGAKRHRGIDILRRPVYPGALGPVEGQFLAVLGEQVLAEKFPQVLKQVPEPAQHRVIATDSLPGLGHIGDIHVDHRQQQHADDQGNHHGADFEKHQGEVL